MASLRFVVLYHEGLDEPHYDLLFEWDVGGPLTSFRCPTWTPSIDDRLEERPDHRRDYLTFEGTLAGDRGRVTRVAAGALVHEILASDPPTLALTFDGEWTLVIANAIANGPATFTTWIVLATR